MTRQPEGWAIVALTIGFLITACGGIVDNTVPNGTAGAAGAGWVVAGHPKPFSCGSWKRDPQFDAIRVNGKPLSGVLDTWGSGPNDIYVNAQNNESVAIVEHWDGSSWKQENLNPALPEDGLFWGSGPNDVYVTAHSNDLSDARLYHSTGNGTWTVVPNVPSAIGFIGLWGLDASHVFLMGVDAKYVDHVWRKSGVNWVDTSAPGGSAGSMAADDGFSYLWGLDASHVFLLSNKHSNADNLKYKVKSFLYMWDGSSWKSVSIPAGTKQLREIHGTSLDDLWITAVSGKGSMPLSVPTQSVLWHVTDNFATWTKIVVNVDEGYTSVLSLRHGTALAGTVDMMHITTFDEVSLPQTKLVDVMHVLKAPSGFWVEPDGKTVHFLVFAGKGGEFYTGTCK